MKSFILSSMIVMIVLSKLPGQSSPILENYLVMGLEHNLALQQQALNVQNSMESLKQAQSLFYPNISFDASYMRAHGGRTIDVPIGDLINPIYENLNALTDQNRFPTNLTNEQIQLIPDNFHDTRITLRQPLFNSDIYHNYRVQKSLIGLAESKRLAYQQELVKEIKTGYYRYLQAESVKAIYRNTRQVLQELLRVNRSLVENHKATMDAVYRAEFEISDIESQIAQAEKSVIVAKSYFNFLLNRDLDSEILIDSGLTQSALSNQQLSHLQQQAVNSRHELDQLEYAIESQRHSLNLQKGRKLPDISLGAQAGYQGFGYHLGDNQHYALLSLNLEVPLFTGFNNNSKIQQSKVRLTKLQLEYQNLESQIRLQVIEALRNYQAARASYQAKQAAAKSAEKNFHIISRKYQENLVLLVEFLDARAEYTNSQTSLAIARYQVLIRNAQLERAVAYSLNL